MFESPLEWCSVCKEWVALDQSFIECARIHGCRIGNCPLAALLHAPQAPPCRDPARGRDLPLR